MHGKTVRVEVFRQGETKGHGRFYVNHKEKTCLQHHRFNPDVSHESDLPMFEPIRNETVPVPEIPEQKAPQVPYTETKAETRNANEGASDVRNEQKGGSGNGWSLSW
ncbi:hypothetical protein [Magnetovibrio blakemorei]|uniref:hypothetical protein n=1 Tax=Magnetovibrio blakemorei TaxID=28181 RepID=UPI00147B8290|nr:hypothetical protein [Magnetovibrio blakemorei]